MTHRHCCINKRGVGLNSVWGKGTQGKGKAMSFARPAACAAILTILSAGCAFAKSVAIAADTNLRNGPGTDSEIVTLIPKGSTVDVSKCANGWCQVSWDGQEGYAIARNLGMAGALRQVRRPAYVVEGDDYGPPVAYGPGPVYVVPPPVYYGYGPYYYGRPYWGRGWRRW